MNSMELISDKNAEMFNGGFLNWQTLFSQNQAASTSTVAVPGFFGGTSASAGAASSGTNNVNIGSSGLNLLSFTPGAIYRT